jgi:hypothetical protein
MVIGFRAYSDGFSYVILEGSQSSIKVIENDRVKIPKNSDWPAGLSWVRKQLAEIFQNHEIVSSCIKTIEPSARTKSKERYQIEAIFHEYCYTSNSLLCITRINSQLKRDIKDLNQPARYLKRIFNDNEQLAELDKPQYHEVALAAISELPIE